MESTSLLLLLLVTLNLVSPQDAPKPKPDLTGTWISAEITLKVRLQATKLTIKRTVRSKEPVSVPGRLEYPAFSSERVYFTDGRGETQKFTRTQSTSNWQGDKLVIHTPSLRNIDGSGDTDVTETWQVSEDGSELKITRLIRASSGEKTLVEIFVRKK
jgi:hypothetical protein